MPGAWQWSQIVKIPSYEKDSFPEKLNYELVNSKPSIYSVKSTCQFILCNLELPRSYSKCFVIFWIAEDDFMGSQSCPRALGILHKLSM